MGNVMNFESLVVTPMLRYRPVSQMILHRAYDQSSVDTHGVIYSILDKKVYML